MSGGQAKTETQDRVLVCESHSQPESELVWSCSERQLVCRLCHNNHHILSLGETR